MLVRSLTVSFIFALAFSGIALDAHAADVSFNWLPNSESSLSCYYIHYGSSSKNYSQTVKVTKSSVVNGRVQGTVSGLATGTTYYFAATAATSSGVESGYSSEVKYTPAATTTTPVANTGTGTTTPVASTGTSSGNSAPVAGTSAFTVQENATYSGKLGGSDTDKDLLTFAVVTKPKYGTATVNSDGSFSYTANTYSSSSDSFTFTVNDGKVTSAAAKVSITITAKSTATADLPMEGGEVSVGNAAVRVSFSQPFAHPVVIANMVTRKGGTPCVVRIQNVNSTGFNVQVENYDYMGRYHTRELVSYIVMEQGTYTLADGKKVEAGIFNTAATSAAAHTFKVKKSAAPVVLTSIVTINEASAVTGRVRDITATGFKYFMQEQERNAQKHAAETIHYIAWEPGAGTQNGMRYLAGRTGNTVTNGNTGISLGTSFKDVPVIAASMQTSNDLDTASLRIPAANRTAIAVTIEEERSKDTEVTHGKETAGYLAVLPN